MYSLKDFLTHGRQVLQASWLPPRYRNNKPRIPSTNHVNARTLISQEQLPVALGQCQKLLSSLKQQSLIEIPSSINQVGSSQPSTNQSLLNFLGINSIFSTFSIQDTNNSVFSSTHSSIFSTKFVDIPWIIDTGVTDYIFCSTSFFTKIDYVVNTIVKLPNGNSISVTYVGSVKFSNQSVLSNVLCAPSFNFNLLSARKLTHSISCCLIFLSKHCLI